MLPPPAPAEPELPVPSGFAPPTITPMEPLSAPSLDPLSSPIASLGADWTVYRHPRIGLDRPDVIAIHDEAGVCLLDVLDWTPETTRSAPDGGIERFDGTAWNAIPFDPRRAAARTRSAIYDQFFAMPEHGGAATSAIRTLLLAPAFDTASLGTLFGSLPTDDAVGLVGLCGGDTMSWSFESVVRGLGGPTPPAESIAKLRSHVSSLDRVVPDGPALPASIDWIAQNASNARRRRVDGPAGSGKSTAVAARAARLAADGYQVLALTFNVTFANGLRALVDQRCQAIGAEPANVSCANFHSFLTRVVQDAELAGESLTASRGAPWTTAIFEKAAAAYQRGNGRRYDAIVIDEGQDFSREWWDLLADHVLVAGGEMLVAADVTQNIYDRADWLDDVVPVGREFDETISLQTSMRAPDDLVGVTSDFARSFLENPSTLPEAGSGDAPVVRRWGDVEHLRDLGTAVGLEVVELLAADPTLRPSDVAFVCDYHHDGVRAAQIIERAGIPVHHIFSRNPDDPRRRRKHRFWLGAEAVKGCTAHSIKGWDARAVVLGIGVDDRAAKLAYVAMTRSGQRPSGPSVVSVINADPRLHDFAPRFVQGSPSLPTAPDPAAPIEPLQPSTPSAPLVAPAPPAPAAVIAPMSPPASAPPATAPLLPPTAPGPLAPPPPPPAPLVPPLTLN